MRYANRPWLAEIGEFLRWQQCVHAGLALIEYVLGQAQGQGKALPDVDAFACPGMFTAEDLKGFHGLDERMSVENLKLGTQIIHDATLRVAT